MCKETAVMQKMIKTKNKKAGWENSKLMDCSKKAFFAKTITTYNTNCEKKLNVGRLEQSIARIS